MKKGDIAIIGVGNMGGAIADGLLRNITKLGEPTLVLNDPVAQLMRRFASDDHVRITDSAFVAARQAPTVILAVKPQTTKEALISLRPCITSKHLIISIAAGIEIGSIKKIIGKKVPVVRVMPNICAKVGESMSVWTESPEVSATQKKRVIKILNSIGKELHVKDEGLLDVATAAAGSGPAYFFYMTEILERWAVKNGFSVEEAALLAHQTSAGSAKMLAASGEKAEVLRKAVTSKKGTTDAAIKSMDKLGFKKAFQRGITSARRRARELRG